MIRIFMISEVNNQLAFELSAVQYTVDRRTKHMTFRINVNGSTQCLDYEDIEIIAMNNGIIEISAYMTEEKLREFEAHF